MLFRSDVCLDDPNLTKSVQLCSLKQRLTKTINVDFSNLTKNVVNQKDSNLCVPISVTSLIRHALREDDKVGDWEMERNFTFEKIFAALTMEIFPRSLAGLNLNPKEKEKDFQTFNEVELLLKRIKLPTYLNKSGWKYISGLGIGLQNSTCDFSPGKSAPLLIIFLFQSSFTRTFLLRAP